MRFGFALNASAKKNGKKIQGKKIDKANMTKPNHFLSGPLAYGDSLYSFWF